jgi:sugar lactone lactonase YvrE
MNTLLTLGSLLLILVLQGDAQTHTLNNAFYYSSGIVVDSHGNAFVTGKNKRVIKITPEGKAELFAGGGRNDQDGQGPDAGLSNTDGIAIDSSDNLYVTDNTKIRRITPDGTVSTIAGVARAESRDGDRTTASFLHLTSIAIDTSGTIYVTDYAPGKDWAPGRATNSGDYFIRKITSQGTVTTLRDSNNEALILRFPKDLACDKEGNLYVSASVGHCIKRISAADGVITTAAGQCDKTIFNSVYKEGDVNTAVLTSPTGIAIAANGDLYMSDDRMNRIIKVAGGRVTTVAGSGTFNFKGNPAGASQSGDVDGKATQAMFDAPTGIAFDRSGNLYIVDGSSKNNSYVRRLSPAGIVSTFCRHYWNPATQQYEARD